MNPLAGKGVAKDHRATLRDLLCHRGINLPGRHVTEVADRHRRDAGCHLGLNPANLLFDKRIDCREGRRQIHAGRPDVGFCRANGRAEFFGHGFGHLLPPALHCQRPRQRLMMPSNGSPQQAC